MKKELPVKNGIVCAYEAASARRLRVDSLQQDGPANFPVYFPLMCDRSMLNGEGKLDTLMNERYPSIRLLTVRDYVARERL